MLRFPQAAAVAIEPSKLLSLRKQHVGALLQLLPQFTQILATNVTSYNKMNSLMQESQNDADAVRQRKVKQQGTDYSGDHLFDKVDTVIASAYARNGAPGRSDSITNLAKAVLADTPTSPARRGTISPRGSPLPPLPPQEEEVNEFERAAMEIQAASGGVDLPSAAGSPRHPRKSSVASTPRQLLQPLQRSSPVPK